MKEKQYKNIFARLFVALVKDDKAGDYDESDT